MNYFNKYKMDTELFISAIESKKCIWDLACDEYKDRDAKNKAFLDVAAVVVHDFDRLGEKEKKEAVLLVQKRWKTARDAYVRDRAKLKKIKTGEAAKRIKKYVYFDNLQFLERTLDLNKTETNLDADEANRGEQSNEAVNLSESDVEEDVDPVFKETQSKENFTRKKRKKTDTLDNKLIAFIDETAKNEVDDHKAFFTSLLPQLKSFTETQTLQFRSEVLRIIMEIKHVVPHQLSLQKAHLSVPKQNVVLPHFNENNIHNWQPVQSSSSNSYYSDQTSHNNSSDAFPMISPTSSYSTYSISSNPNHRPTLLQLSGTQLDDERH